MNKKLFLFSLIILVFFLGLYPSYAIEPLRGGIVKIGVDSAAVGLDPMLSISFASYMYIEHVYQNLLRLSPDMDIEPCLAESWEQPDDLTYIFHLRKGVMFHHGREMTSDDVIFSINRLICPIVAAPRGDMLAAVESVEEIDRYTVKITLSEPDAEFLTKLTVVRFMAVIPRDIVEKEGDLQTVSIGTGPFILKEYIHGEGATYVRNDNYWEEGLPYLDGMELIVIQDESSLRAALRRGTIDIGWFKEILMAEMISRTDPDILIVESAPARRGWITCNLKTFPFENTKLRQAVSAALDPFAFIDRVIHGYGQLTTLIPPSSVPYSMSQEEIIELPFYRQDYDLAKQLLAEAGYPDGFEFTLLTSPHSPDYVPSAELIQDQLAPIGIKVNIELMEWGVYTSEFRRHGRGQAGFAASAWMPSPSGYYMINLHSTSPANVHGINDPQLDRLMELTVSTVDPALRLEYSRQLQRHAAEQCYEIFLYAMPSRVEMIRNEVKNYNFLANNGRELIREAWLER